MADIHKEENRYSIKKNELNEWHVFSAKAHLKGTGCKPLSEKSICESMDRDEMIEEINCLTDELMRGLCLEKGRIVCGTCVSHLYKTLSDEEETIMNS
jgi:hypothetical protein